MVLTLDPAAAYANLLHQRAGVEYAVAHPCHPSVFLQRRTPEELADTFGGITAPQDVVAALESGDEDKRAITEEVIRLMYAPVVDVHWVTVKQLAYLEPTLVETVACMAGDLLKEALHETVHTVGVPEAAARAMLLGHVQVALANTLKGDNPFSDACLIAMDYGREKIHRCQMGTQWEHLPLLFPVEQIPWSPLARGRLTRDWDEETPRSQTDELGSNMYRPGDRVIVEQVARIAADRQVPRARVALAWVANRPGVTAPIIGATKPHHIDDAVAAHDLVLTDDERQQLESAYEPHHPVGF